MPEGDGAGNPQPEFVISSHGERLVEEAEPIVQFLSPHRLWTRQAIPKEPPPVKLPGLESPGSGSGVESLVFSRRYGSRGINHSDGRMLLEVARELLESNRRAAIIGIRIGEIFSCRHADPAVPGGVKGLSFGGSKITDVRMDFLKFLHHYPLIFRRSAVDDNDFSSIENGLRDEIFKAAANEPLGFVRGDQGRDQGGVACRIFDRRLQQSN